jgi:hypothetical protein
LAEIFFGYRRWVAIFPLIGEVKSVLLRGSQLVLALWIFIMHFTGLPERFLISEFTCLSIVMLIPLSQLLQIVLFSMKESGTHFHTNPNHQKGGLLGCLLLTISFCAFVPMYFESEAEAEVFFIKSLPDNRPLELEVSLCAKLLKVKDADFSIFLRLYTGWLDLTDIDCHRIGVVFNILERCDLSHPLILTILQTQSSVAFDLKGTLKRLLMDFKDVLFPLFMAMGAAMFNNLKKAAKQGAQLLADSPSSSTQTRSSQVDTLSSPVAIRPRTQQSSRTSVALLDLQQLHKSHGGKCALSAHHDGDTDPQEIDTAPNRPSFRRLSSVASTDLQGYDGN